MQLKKTPICIFFYTFCSFLATNAMGQEVKIGTITKNCNCKKEYDFYMEFKSGGNEKIFFNKTEGRLTFVHHYWAVSVRPDESVIFYDPGPHYPVVISYKESAHGSKPICELPDRDFAKNGTYTFTEKPN